MKKRYRILACCLCYIAASAAIYYSVDKSIDKKSARLRNAAVANLNLFFESKPKYVDLLYGPYGCDYKEVQIPAPEEPDADDVLSYIKTVDPTLTVLEAADKVRQNLKKAWEKRYGDYRSLYKLDVFPAEDDNLPRTGWALKVVCKQPEWTHNDGIETYLVFPKQIAYKKIAPLLYGGVPSVETAMQEALDFTTKNEKSDLQPYYERGSTYNLISKMESAINNEYYHLTEDPEGKFFYSAAGEFGHKRPSIEYGGMHNGYYEVTYHRTQPKSYSIQFVGNLQSDKCRLTAIYIALLTLAMSGLAVFIVKRK